MQVDCATLSLTHVAQLVSLRLCQRIPFRPSARLARELVHAHIGTDDAEAVKIINTLSAVVNAANFWSSSSFDVLKHVLVHYSAVSLVESNRAITSPCAL